jgi:beta-lactamase regulating signal transducer with metallopeptidase domain
MHESWLHLASASTGLLHWAQGEIFLSTIVCVVVLCLCRLLRGRAPALQYALWALVFVRLILPPAWSHPLSAGGLMSRWGQPPVAGEIAADLLVATGDASHPLNTLAPTVDPDHRTGAPQPVAPLLVMLWATVAIVVGVRAAQRRRAYRRVIRNARSATDPVVTRVVDRWRARLGVRRQVRVVTSQLKISPFTMGFLRPVVFVPEQVLALPDHATECVIAHEIAHVARWDCLWLVLQHTLQAVYFFHPAVWVSGAGLDHERERVCDTLVLAHGDIAGTVYARSILDVVQLELQSIRAPSLSQHSRRLKMRIHSIVDRTEPRRPRHGLAVITAAILGLFLLPLAGTAHRAPVVATPPLTATIAAAGAPSQVGTPPDTATGSAALEFDNPVPTSRITWRHERGRSPWTGEEMFHKGFDLAAPAGTPVLAPADGVVVVATPEYGPCDSCGTVVILDHGDGYTTFYSHLGPLHVEPGQQVTRRDVLADVGSTGLSTGPHVHFEVRVDGAATDPSDFVTEWKDHR